MDEAQQVERTDAAAIQQEWEALPDSVKLALMHEALMQFAERSGTMAAEVLRLRAEVDELRERNLEGLRQRIELGEALFAHKGAIEVQKCQIWACMVASPEARALLERERPNFRESMKQLGVDESNLDAAVQLLEGSLTWANAERCPSLHAFIARLWFDLVGALQAAVSPSRWTFRGVAVCGIVTACAALLALV